MKYNKSAGGPWIDADKIVSGTKAKLVSECILQDSKYTYPDGNAKKENIAQIRIQGDTEAKNIRINWSSIYALMEAFGEDSKDWIGKILTVKTLDAMVGDTMRTIVYLIPEGFDLIKNAEKKMEIRRQDGVAKSNLTSEDDNGEVYDISEIPF